MSAILWFIVIYFLFRFIFKFVIPLISATQAVRSKVDQMRQNTENFQSGTSNGATINSDKANFNKANSNAPGSKGDYIDFEEIK